MAQWPLAGERAVQWGVPGGAVAQARRRAASVTAGGQGVTVGKAAAAASVSPPAERRCAGPGGSETLASGRA